MITTTGDFGQFLAGARPKFGVVKDQGKRQPKSVKKSVRKIPPKKGKVAIKTS